MDFVVTVLVAAAEDALAPAFSTDERVFIERFRELVRRIEQLEGRGLTKGQEHVLGFAHEDLEYGRLGRAAESIRILELALPLRTP
jgi:hypothetical protein